MKIRGINVVVDAVNVSVLRGMSSRIILTDVAIQCKRQRMSGMRERTLPSEREGEGGRGE